VSGGRPGRGTVTDSDSESRCQCVSRWHGAAAAAASDHERWGTGTNPRKSSSALTSHFLVYDQTLRVRFFTTCHGSFLRHCKVLVYASLFSIPPSVADWGFQRPCAEWDLCQFPTSRSCRRVSHIPVICTMKSRSCFIHNFILQHSSRYCNWPEPRTRECFRVW